MVSVHQIILLLGSRSQAQAPSVCVCDRKHNQNVLGPWYFTTLLIPALRAAVPDGGARVVTVASSGADFLSKIEWKAFTDSPERRAVGPQNLYIQSKFFNVVASKDLAQRYAGTGIIFSSLNPGGSRPYPIAKLGSLYRRQHRHGLGEALESFAALHRRAFVFIFHLSV